MAGIKEQASISSSEIAPPINVILSQIKAVLEPQIAPPINVIRSQIKAVLEPQQEKLLKDYLIVKGNMAELQAKIQEIIYPGESDKSPDIVIFQLEPYSGAGTVDGLLDRQPIRQFVSRGRLQGTPFSVASVCLRISPDVGEPKVSNILMMESWGGREKKELSLNGAQIILGSTVDPEKGIKLCKGEDLDPSFLPK